MIIGIPKEIMHGEGRVSAIPETVALLKAEGFEVLVENTAGEGALFADSEYAAAGATMIADAEELYAKADIILKNQSSGMLSFVVLYNLNNINITKRIHLCNDARR